MPSTLHLQSRTAGLFYFYFFFLRARTPCAPRFALWRAEALRCNQLRVSGASFGCFMVLLLLLLRAQHMLDKPCTTEPPPTHPHPCGGLIPRVPCMFVQLPHQSRATRNRLLENPSGLGEVPPCPPMRPPLRQPPEEVKGEGLSMRGGVSLRVDMGPP